MRMKLTVAVLAAMLLSLTSCTWMYFDNDDTAHIEAKRTIKPFSHLKEPIVITMPVYSNRHLFGNKNWDSMQDQKGDIFVVIDIATNTVWDWIFFPGQHGWTNWRCVEAGSNPTLYCSAGMGSGLVGCLDPTKTTLDVYDAGTNDVVYSYSTPGSHIIIPDEFYDQAANTLVYRIRSFNTKTGKIEGVADVPTDTIGHFDHPQADDEGNYWFGYYYKSENCIGMYNVGQNKTDLLKVEETFPFNQQQDEYYTASVCHVDDKYIIGKYSRLGAEVVGYQMFAMDKKTKKIEKIPLPATWDINFYCYEAVEIDGKYYGIHPHRITDDYTPQVRLSEIDVEKKELREIATIDIDMTETVYVRGSRLYLMKSRNISDIYYTYYDFATKETGRMVNIRYEDVVGR